MSKCAILIYFMLLCVLAFISTSSAHSLSKNTTSIDAKHSFEFDQWSGPALKVWAYKPSGFNPTSRILFVMHGTNRDADRYRDEWVQHAEKFNILLIAPQFTRRDFPKASGYNLGNVFVASSNYQTTNPVDKWAYSAIEPLFDFVKSKYQSTQNRYNIYGHSAGAQFVHRFIFFVPQARISKIITANAGWYTLPNYTSDFPYGLHNSPVSKASLKQALQKPVVILLGEADNNPNHKSLRRSKEAMLQGPHRFARGHYFYARALESAHELQVVLNWQIKTVPNVGHKNRLMAQAAILELVP
jgi:poly(3-hydroxybutyrate) depolymerase